MGCLACSGLPGGIFSGTSPERKGRTSQHRRPRRHVDHYQWPTPESGRWWDRCSSRDASNLLQQTRLSAFVDSFCRPWLVMKRCFNSEAHVSYIFEITCFWWLLDKQHVSRYLDSADLKTVFPFQWCWGWKGWYTNLHLTQNLNNLNPSLRYQNCIIVV